MSAPVKTKLQRDLETCLRETGLPWRIECGKKHRIVFLNGVQIGVFSNGQNNGFNAGLNLMSIIRRAGRKAKAVAA